MLATAVGDEHLELMWIHQDLIVEAEEDVTFLDAGDGSRRLVREALDDEPGPRFEIEMTGQVGSEGADADAEPALHEHGGFGLGRGRAWSPRRR